MNFEGALRDDVLPFAWEYPTRDQYVTADRAPVDAESLHLRIDPPERSHWIQRFPQMTSLRFLEVKSRPNQDLFRAICTAPNLERLNIYWSNIENLECITSLRKLTHLKLGNSPKVRSLEPLASLKSLVALGISGVKLCRDLSPVGELTNLRGLMLTGGGLATLASTQIFESLSPLSALGELVYFSIFGVRTEDESLAAVSAFRKLKYLQLGTLNHWPASEYVRLRAAHPHVDCEDLQLAATDSSFRRANKIR